MPLFVIFAIRHLWVPMTMQLKTVECEVERLLAVIGGKWKVLILRELFNGARRHAQLCRALPGISQKVLTAQLARTGTGRRRAAQESLKQNARTSSTR